MIVQQKTMKNFSSIADTEIVLYGTRKFILPYSEKEVQITPQKGFKNYSLQIQLSRILFSPSPKKEMQKNETNAWAVDDDTYNTK